MYIVRNKELFFKCFGGGGGGGGGEICIEGFVCVLG